MTDLYSCITRVERQTRTRERCHESRRQTSTRASGALYSCIFMSRESIVLLYFSVFGQNNMSRERSQDVTCIICLLLSCITSCIINCVIQSLHTCSIFSFSFSPFLQVIIKRHSSQTFHPFSHSLNSLHSL